MKEEPTMFRSVSIQVGRRISGGGGGDIGVMGGLGGRLLVERWYSNATTKELKGRFATADPEVGKTADR